MAKEPKEQKPEGFYEKVMYHLDNWQKNLVLAASVGALIMALFAKCSADESVSKIKTAEKQIDSTQQKVDKLIDFNELSRQVASNIKIDRIRTTRQNNVFCLEGTFTEGSSLSEENTLLVLVNEGNSYWLMKGDVVLQSDGMWFHNNIVLNLNPGPYKMLLVLCQETMVDLIQDTYESSGVASVYFDGKPKWMNVVKSSNLLIEDGKATLVK